MTEPPVAAHEVRELARRGLHMATIARQGMPSLTPDEQLHARGMIDGLEMMAHALLMLSVVLVAAHVDFELPVETKYRAKDEGSEDPVEQARRQI